MNGETVEIDDVEIGALAGLDRGAIAEASVVSEVRVAGAAAPIAGE